MNAGQYPRLRVDVGDAYRWSSGEDGRPRAWWIDVAQPQLEPEVEWLQAEIYGYPAEVPSRRLTAFDRYSERA